MEDTVVQKINLLNNEKNNLLKILKAGRKCHEIVPCSGDNCWCIKFIYELDQLIKNLNGENLNLQEQSTFFLLCLNNQIIFLFF